MKKVTVIGGGRGIGLETVKALLERGFAVTAFSRSATAIPLKHENLKLRPGDALNASDISDAVAEADAVVQALGVPLDLKLITGPINLFSRATAVMLPVLDAHAIKRLVAVTGFGAGDSASAIHPLQRIPFQVVFGKAYDDKTVQEELIKSSDLDWTIVRPGVLTNKKICKNYRVRMTPSEWRNGIISRSAVADYIASSIEDPVSFRTEPVLAN